MLFDRRMLMGTLRLVSSYVRVNWRGEHVVNARLLNGSSLLYCNTLRSLCQGHLADFEIEAGLIEENIRNVRIDPNLAPQLSVVSTYSIALSLQRILLLHM